MRISLFLALLAIFSGLGSPVQANDASGAVKDWTFLVFLNGNNNLDSFGTMNLKQMEKIGSTDNLNIVVQWASLRKKKTTRLYIKKSSDPQNVTSPVVQDLGQADMGDWRTLVEFVRWGVEHYPAKHYFINIWDHGSGWHSLRARGLLKKGIHPTDISWDDNTGNSITTQQLGQALAESAKIIGHKVDLYGSDACLMAMAEVANEVSDSVQVFAGSEETEPGAGWPYDAFLKRWTAQASNSAQDVGRFLTEEYVKSYQGGQNGTSDVTFSAFDLDKMGQMNSAISKLQAQIVGADASTRGTLAQAAGSALSFAYSDYVDLGDFLAQIESKKITGFEAASSSVKEAMGQFVIAHGETGDLAKAQGLSIWIPSSSYSVSTYENIYTQMKFNIATQWLDAIKAILN